MKRVKSLESTTDLRNLQCDSWFDWMSCIKGLKSQNHSEARLYPVVVLSDVEGLQIAFGFIGLCCGIQRHCSAQTYCRPGSGCMHSNISYQCIVLCNAKKH